MRSEFAEVALQIASSGDPNSGHFESLGAESAAAVAAAATTTHHNCSPSSTKRLAGAARKARTVRVRGNLLFS